MASYLCNAIETNPTASPISHCAAYGDQIPTGGKQFNNESDHSTGF